MNRLNKMCDYEVKWWAACVHAGHCFPAQYGFHNIRGAIRYNAKESISYYRTMRDAENIINNLKNYFPNITDWELTIKLPEEKKRVKE